jgi:hypothetical protein
MTKEELIFYPDLLPFPQSLLQDKNAYITERAGNYGDADVAVSRNGVAYTSSRYIRLKVNQKIRDWVYEHVGTDCNHDIGYSLIQSGQLIPHTDTSRDWVLIWLVKTGGPAVDTVFWREKNKSFFPEPNTHPETYEDLIEICRTNIAVGQWVMLNARCLHSVENIVDGPRIALQIGFMNDAISVVGLKKLSIKHL